MPSASRERGIGGIKLKVGQPDAALDVQRVQTVRKHLGDAVPLMVDANQQWDRPTAQRMCRMFEQFNLVWIEEPLDAYDDEGHAALAAQFDTPIATGEMLTSVGEHWDLIRLRAADYVMPDAPRVGGITPFLKVAALAEHAGSDACAAFRDGTARTSGAAYPREPWVEHFEWLEPLFNERLEIKDGRMLVPTRPGPRSHAEQAVESLDPRRSGDGQAPVARDLRLYAGRKSVAAFAATPSAPLFGLNSSRGDFNATVRCQARDQRLTRFRFSLALAIGLGHFELRFSTTFRTDHTG